MKKALLLEDGLLFWGEAFGSLENVIGEIVFTTGMSGYQETITDHSYCGQCITFTYPMIGNYGINADDMESIQPTCLAVICKEYARKGSNWRNTMSIDDFCKAKGIVGLAGIDTRKLTRHLRSRGVMKGWLINEADLKEDCLAQLQITDLPTNQIPMVSAKNPYPNPHFGKRVVVLDFGLKHSILRELGKRDCNVTVVPYDTSAQDILDISPDGVMLTNGPGDPKDCPQAIETIRQLLGKLPVFGICMGHQLLALALGCDTYKMKFGHRGLNHPVREIATGRIDFTSQNHGYAVAVDSIDKEQILITHVEINDGSVEGIRHRYYPAMSVQFHPDAAPGPHDAAHVFDEFIDLMDGWKGREQWQND